MMVFLMGAGAGRKIMLLSAVVATAAAGKL